jgi:hypothetical protein
MNLPLKVAVLNSGLTQRAVSLAAAIPETRFSSIVRGHVEADADERQRVARVLGVSENRIFLQIKAVEGAA